MTTRTTAKQNGYSLQKQVVEKLKQKFAHLDSQAIISAPNSTQGEDIVLSDQARKVFPYSIECKYRASLGLYQFYEQAQTNAKGHEPLVVVKSLRKKPLVIVDLDHFLGLLGE